MSLHVEDNAFNTQSGHNIDILAPWGFLVLIFFPLILLPVRLEESSKRSATLLSQDLEDGNRLRRLRAHCIVWIDARVADEAVRIDDEPARNREPPGVVAVESLKVYSVLAVQLTQIIWQSKD